MEPHFCLLSSSSLRLPDFLFALYIHILFHPSLSAVKGSICVQSMPASFALLSQYSMFFSLSTLALGMTSSYLFHPNTAILGSLAFSIRITCPILSRTLFLIFHSILLMHKMFRISCIFTPMRFICLKGGSVLIATPNIPVRPNICVLLELFYIFLVPVFHITVKQHGTFYTRLHYLAL